MEDAEDRQVVRQTASLCPTCALYKKNVCPSHHFRTGGVIQDIKFRATGQEDFDLSVLDENSPTQRFPLQP